MNLLWISLFFILKHPIIFIAMPLWAIHVTLQELPYMLVNKEKEQADKGRALTWKDHPWIQRISSINSRSILKETH